MEGSVSNELSGTGRQPDAPVLVVDLDNCLIRTDLLHESFFDQLARRPMHAVLSVFSLARGRGALKARLAEDSQIDAAHLPFHNGVLEQVRAARADGRRTALVSASDERLVHAVADHLGCFDEAHGSSPALNLKGANKAAFVSERYGPDGFDYIADSAADLPVWKAARRAITVGAPASLKRRVDALGVEVEHMPVAEGRHWLAYFRAIRPHQWLKNLLVFLPLIAAHELAAAPWVTALAAFWAFSLVASATYLLNDLLDLSADRAHPRKRRRPFAAGDVPILHGVFMMAVLMAGAVGLALAATPPLFWLALAAYLVITLLYSLVLKRRLIIDICTLAVLYTLRVIAGGAAVAIVLSPWMLAFSAFLFLSLAAVKRQAELVDGLNTGRAEAAGRAYRVDDLPIVSMMAISAGYLAVMVFALYINSDAVQLLYKTPAFLWGACPVLLFWVSRMVMVAHRGNMVDDPLVFAVRDRVSLASGLLVLALAVAGTVL